MRTDYRIYRLDARERIRYYLVCGGLFFGLGLLFYRSIPAAAVCCLASLLLRGRFEALCASRRRKLLCEGFRDALYVISGAVAGGRQLPSALADAARQSADRDPGSDIARELGSIASAYEISHARIEDLLADLGRRSGIPEISHFASSYRICRSCGGDIESVCLKSANLLIDRLEFHRQAEALIAQKRLDIILLTALPLLILLFLNLVSFAYLRPLYTTLLGRAVMTACLAAMVGAFCWGLKIVDLDL